MRFYDSKISISSFIAASILTSSVTATAFAQTNAQQQVHSTSITNNSSEDPLNKLSEVVVTATRIPTAADNVLASVTTITRDDLSRSLSPDIAEALQFQAGVDVIRSGGVGQPISVFIRGANSNHTLVLLDGVRMNPATAGNAALQNIPPEMIDHIEIVKGPRSTLYGSDAIGGVINIITRNVTEPGVNGAAQIGYGSDNTRQASGLFGIAGHAGEIDINGAWTHSDGFPLRESSTTDSPFSDNSFGAHASTNFGSVEASGRFFQSRGTSNYLDFSLAPISQDFINRVTALKFSGKPSNEWNTQLNLSRLDDLIQQNQLNVGPDPDYLRTTRYTADWQNIFSLAGNNQLVAGAIYQKENARALSYGTFFDNDTHATDLYLEDRSTEGAQSLVVALGYTKHSNFSGIFTWNGEYGFAFGPSTQLVASAGTAFHAPDASDRFGYGGNPDLKPERSHNYEVSLRQKISAQEKLSLSVFQNVIDSLITSVEVAPFTYLAENIDRARIRGVEGSYDYTAVDWRLHLEASYQEPINTVTGQLLLRRAKKSASATYEHAYGSFDFGINANLVGPREDFGSVELHSYVLANINARYHFGPGFSVNAEVQNALNTHYEVVNGYNTAGRGYFVSAKYQTR